jgi:hypothetical protein
MPSNYILGLIARMRVHPTPLFRDDVDSDADASAVDNADNDETMATVAPEPLGEDPQRAEASGEKHSLIPSIGMLDPEGYVDMREPWIEGAKGEKVCCSGICLGALTD